MGGTKIITKSGNIGQVNIKRTVNDKYDNHYGWGIYWENEPNGEEISIDQFIYTL
jgi:hypothetical protein